MLVCVICLFLSAWRAPLILLEFPVSGVQSCQTPALLPFFLRGGQRDGVVSGVRYSLLSSESVAMQSSEPADQRSSVQREYCFPMALSSEAQEITFYCSFTDRLVQVSYVCMVHTLFIFSPTLAFWGQWRGPLLEVILKEKWKVKDFSVLGLIYTQKFEGLQSKILWTKFCLLRDTQNLGPV